MKVVSLKGLSSNYIAPVFLVRMQNFKPRIEKITAVTISLEFLTQAECQVQPFLPIGWRRLSLEKKSVQKLCACNQIKNIRVSAVSCHTF
jgi:hypothetical protein